MATSSMVDVRHAEQIVIKALENPKYVWRTFAGIKRETGLPSEAISATLKHLPDDTLVVSSTGDGKRVYSTRRHYRKTQSFVGKFLSILSDRAV